MPEPFGLASGHAGPAKPRSLERARLFALLRLGARYWRGHPARLASALLAVALAAALALSSALVLRSLHRGERLLLQNGGAAGDLQALATAEEGMQASWQRALHDPSVSALEPVLVKRSVALGEGERLVVQLRGVRSSHAAYRSRLLAGRFFAAEEGVLVSAALARRLELDPGGTLELTTPRGFRRYPVLGVYTPPELAEAALGVLAPLGLVQEDFALGEPLVSWFELSLVPNTGPSADPSADPEAVAERLQERLGRVALLRPAGAAEASGLGFAGLAWALVLLAALSLLAAVYLLLSNLALMLVERGPALAQLRALGASPRTLALAVRLELHALVLSGLLLGAGLGWGLASSLVRLSASSVLLLAPLWLEPVRLGWHGALALALAYLLMAGVGLAFLRGALRSGAAPRPERVRRLHRCAPALGVLRRVGLAVLVLSPILLSLTFLNPATLGLTRPHSTDTRSAPGSTPPGLASPESGDGARRAALLAAALLLGAALAVPLLSGALERRLRRWPGAPTWLLLALALRQREGRQSGVALASLMLALTLLTGVFGVVHSYRVSLERWLEQMFTWDLIVSQQDFGLPAALPISDEVRLELAVMPGVALVAGDSLPVIKQDRLEAQLYLFERSGFPDSRQFESLAGASAEDLPGVLASGRYVALSRTLAERNGLAVGDGLSLVTPTGEYGYDVRAIVEDVEAAQNGIFMDREVYLRDWRDASVDLFTVALTEEADREAVAELIRVQLSERYPIAVRSVEEYRDELERQVRESFGFGQALVLLFVAVAAWGLLNVVLASALAVRREVALLSALGAGPALLRRVLLFDLVLHGGFGVLSGLGLGTLLSRVLVQSVQFSSRFTVAWHLPVSAYPVLLLAVLLALGVVGVATLRSLRPSALSG